MSPEKYVVSKIINVEPAKVFEFLANPANHKEADPSDWDWVRDPIENQPITSKDQIFSMKMNLDQMGGDYVMHNLVTEFEPDSKIAWAPGGVSKEGKHRGRGWSWNYEIEPEGDGSKVTLTYDWSKTPADLRRMLGVFPPFKKDYIEKSLNKLDEALTK